MSRSKRQDFFFESLQDNQSIGRYLQELVQGFKSGQIKFAHEDSSLELNPQGLLRLEIKAGSKKDKHSVRIKVSWREDSEKPDVDKLTIESKGD